MVGIETVIHKYFSMSDILLCIVHLQRECQKYAKSKRLNKDYKRTPKMRGALPNVEATLLLGHVAMTHKCYDYKISLFKCENN